jgi:UDP-2,3-diacylglucosamine pyrophosphatase LpxH
METDNITRLQGLFARAFKQLYAKMGREEIERFCLAISRNEDFLTGKCKLRLTMDLEPTESVKVSRPEHHPRKRKRELNKSERLDMTAQNFNKHAVNNVKRLIEGHWHELSTPSVKLISYQPGSDLSVRKRRLNQHLALLQETRDDKTRWMWRGIKLIQYLRSYEVFLDESGYANKNERNSQRARD